MLVEDWFVLREFVGWVDLVVEDVGRTPLAVEEEHIGLDSAVRQEDTRREAEDGVEIETLQKLLLDRLKRLVCLKEHTLRDDHPAASTQFEMVHHVLQKEQLRSIGLDGEVLLYLLLLLPAKGRVCQYAVITVFLLQPTDIFGEGVDLGDVGRLDAVEDHVHTPMT